MRAAVWALAASLAAGAAAAHEFWLQPRAFRVAAGAAVDVALLVGDGPDKQRSAMPARRVTRLSVVGPDGGEQDLRAAFRTGEDARAAFAETGAHVVVLATDEGGRSVLPGDRFEAYLREEGLAPAIAARSGRRDAPGSEAYGRRAKALVQVGAGGPQDVATRPVGLTLEIVPEVSPYATPAPAALPVRVWYEGRPLAGATVKLGDLARDAIVAKQVTDAEGRAAFAMPTGGSWRLSAVWTQALSPKAETDFETVFSSLTFAAP